MYKRFFALLALSAVFAGSAAFAAAEGKTETASATGDDAVSVVELFTSQGCSSCPSADALLGRLAARNDVIALSLPVDYWDYLGWKDTLANPKFTERQKAYKGVLAIPMVYTPMMVVNGLAHVNGSDEEHVLHAIEKSSKTPGATQVPVHLSEKGGHLVIEAAAAQHGTVARDATVWLAVIAKTVEVPITRGENRGKTLTYYNVVRELIPVGMWNGRPLTVELDRQTFMRPGAERCAVLLQQGRAGPIIGAALLKNF